MHIEELNSGLRIAVDEMKEVETVSVGVFVNTGSRNETKEINGISHFLEHMAFKGTKKRNAKQIAEQFEDIGGRINAYTSKEKTVFYAKVLKKDAEFAVEFLADILQNSVFDDVELERERGVILQEIAMTNDTPDDIVFDYFGEVAYPNQALGRTILGPKNNIKKFKRENFINYISKQYNHKNIAITAAGAITQKKLVDLSKKHFTSFKSNEILPVEVPKYQGGKSLKEKSLEQINLVLGFKSSSYQDENHYINQVLAMILGGGMSSRLFQEIRENQGLAYSISAFNQPYSDCGLFGIYAGTTPEKAQKLISSTKKEITKICQSINDQELVRAKNQFKAGLLMAKESTSSRMQRLGNNILSYNRIIKDEEVKQKIDNVTKQDVVAVAKKIFSGKESFAAIGKIKTAKL